MQQRTCCIQYSHTHTHTQPFNSSPDFVWDNQGEPVPEETFTHSHLSWSSIIRYLLPSYITIHGILSVHFTRLTIFSTTSVQVFFGLHFGLASSTSYTIHFFTQSLSSFRSTYPYHRNLFAALPRLCHLILISPSTLYLELWHCTLNLG